MQSTVLEIEYIMGFFNTNTMFENVNLQCLYTEMIPSAERWTGNTPRVVTTISRPAHTLFQFIISTVRKAKNAIQIMLL